MSEEKTLALPHYVVTFSFNLTFSFKNHYEYFNIFIIQTNKTKYILVHTYPY